MPTSITLNDRLAEKVAVLAAEAGQRVDAWRDLVAWLPSAQGPGPGSRIPGQR